MKTYPQSAMLLLVVGVVLLGAALVAWGRLDDRDGMFAIGLLTLVSGVFGAVGYAVLSLADRSGLRRALDREILDERHPVARAGQTVLRLAHAWDIVKAVALVVLVLVLAWFEPIAAAVLIVTGGAALAIWLLFRPEEERRGR